MALPSLQDRVSAILERQTALPRSRGVRSSDLEAVLLFESVAMALLAYPKTVLLLTLLAKGALRKAIQEEVTTLNTLEAAVNDLSNGSYKINGAEHLRSAKLALLQLEASDALSSDSNQFARFSRSIDSFLKGSISKNVRKGGTELARTGAEAYSELPGLLATLNSRHSDVLDRLYSIAVAVENFLSSPIPSMVGSTAIARAKADLDEIITSVASNLDGSISRDVVQRLMVSRSSLKVIGGVPDMFSLSVGGVGREIQARTPMAQASASLGSGALISPVATTITLGAGTAAGVTATVAIPIPHSGDNRAVMYAGQLPGVGSLPADHYLFLNVPTGVSATGTLKILLPAGNPDWNTLCIAINAASVGIQADPLLNGEAVLSADFDFSIGISSTEQDPSVTYATLRTYSNSAHTYLGLQAGQSAVQGYYPLELVADLINRYSYPFNTSVLASIDQESEALRLETTIAEGYGTYLSVDIQPTDIGPLWSTTGYAVSTEVELFYVDTNETVDPTPFINIGDTLTRNGTDYPIVGVSASGVTLGIGVPTFEGAVTITSALVPRYYALMSSIQSFLDTWLPSEFSSDLVTIERAVGALTYGAAASGKATAKSRITALRNLLTSLDYELSQIPVPDVAPSLEKKVLDSVVSSLAERSYDRAADLLLQGRIREVLEMSHGDASYSGAFLQAAESVAKNDLRPTNRTDGANAPVYTTR